MHNGKDIGGNKVVTVVLDLGSEQKAQEHEIPNKINSCLLHMLYLVVDQCHMSKCTIKPTLMS